LELDNLKEAGKGTYKCLVTNSVGSDSKEVTIGVGTSPKVTVTRPTGNLIENSNYTLECSSSVSSDSAYSWIDDTGKKLKEVCD
jgi:PKD repeat protein